MSKKPHPSPPNSDHQVMKLGNQDPYELSNADSRKRQRTEPSDGRAQSCHGIAAQNIGEEAELNTEEIQEIEDKIKRLQNKITERQMRKRESKARTKSISFKDKCQIEGELDDRHGVQEDAKTLRQADELVQDIEPSFETGNNSSFSDKVHQELAIQRSSRMTESLSCERCRKDFEQVWELNRHSRQCRKASSSYVKTKKNGWHHCGI